jgi:hypothetical protein
MRNILILLMLASVGFVSSCQKDNQDNNSIEKLDTLLVIGDTCSSITEFDTLILPTERDDSIVFQVDLDSNSINDFTIYFYYYESPCIYSSILGIYCLSDKNSILCNDSILSPEILEFGDTLVYSNNWVSQKFDMLIVYKDCSGEGETHTQGNWHDLSNKYIGLMTKKDDYLIYGWINLSITRFYYYYLLELHKIGYKKAAYNTRS